MIEGRLSALGMTGVAVPQLNTSSSRPAEGVKCIGICEPRFGFQAVRVFLRLPVAVGGGELGLLSALLERGTRSYPSMRELSIRLSELYGSAVHWGVERDGEAFALTLTVAYPVSGIVTDPDLPEQVWSLVDETVHANLFMDPSFPEEIFRIDRDNAASYIAQSETSPMSKAVRSACRAMLGNDPFGRPFSGMVEEVNELEPERLRALFANAVARAPMRIVSVGPLGTDEISNRMLGVFGGHNRRPAPRPSAFRAPEGVKRVSEQSPGKADQALLFLSLADAKQMRMTDFAATMAIFSGSSLSRIYKRIREERQLVYSHVSLASHSKRLVCIAASARPGRGEEVLDTLEAEAADMAKAAPSEQEMQAMKREMATSMLREMDSPRPMLQLLSGLVRMQGEPDPVKHLDGLLAVRPSRVRAVMESARPFGRFVASGTGNGEDEE